MDKIHDAREALTGAIAEFEAATEAVADATPDTLADAEARCEAAHADVQRRQRVVNNLEEIAEARAQSPALIPAEQKIEVVREESTYRPDGANSFFRDLAVASRDGDAMQRLQRHKAETEKRNVTSASNGFIPPVYLSQYLVEVPRQGRPFADALPKAALPDVGTSFTLPKLSTGTTVAAQTDGGTVSETDVTTTTVTTYVRTIAGQQDISQQLLDRSDPSFDSIIFRDLVRAHDAELDRQLLVGSSSSNEHVGLANVSSINTVTYTSSTPTASELIPKIYSAISSVASNRYLFPTHIVMHPRRAAALAAGASSNVPLFQQGGLFRAFGDQDTGVVGTIAGLPVVIDANIPVTDGAGTNQDAIYVIHAPDLVLMEGELRTRVLDAPLSGTLEVRLQAFSYSAFASERYAKGIAKISGTGLATPSF